MPLTALLDGAVMAERIGTGTPAVLALHGWGRNRSDLVPALTGLDALAVDLPGFGASPAPDRAWGSADYADAHGDADAVKSFWEAEKDTITSKVVGNAQHTVKEAGCGADVAGPVAFSLNDAINKQQQKRLRGKNEAFVMIERYRVTLGPQNVAALEKLGDDVAQSSYDVHVLMVTQRERLRRLVSDKDSAKKTIDRFVKEETAFQTEAGRTDPEKKASADRVTAANKSKGEIDAAASQAEQLSKQMDASTDAAVKDYEAALSALRTKIAEKKKGAPRT